MNATTANTNVKKAKWLLDDGVFFENIFEIDFVIPNLVKWLNSHARRIFLVLVNIIFNHFWFWKVVGAINKRVKWIESIFLAYPANKDYTLAYGYKWQVTKTKWNPYFTGVLRQNGKWVIMFVISASNSDFRDEDNRTNLRHVVERIEFFRKIVCAERKTFAGILPGILLAYRMIRETHERATTVDAVCLGIEDARGRECLSKETPIIILGGCGFIGRKVVEKLRQAKYTTFAVDVNGKPGSDKWPVHLRNQPVIVVNITDNGILGHYIPMFWRGTVVVNEVYPEPKAEMLQQMKQTGCLVYHIVGIRGKAYPSFPHAYHGAIPCCSGHSCDGMEVVLSNL